MALDQEALNSLRLDRDGTAAPARRGWLRRHRKALVAAAVVLLVIGAVALRPEPVALATVAAEAPSGDGRSAVLNASGYVVARRVATVASEVTGRLVQVEIEEGMSVDAGQVLARLDPANARAAFEVARASREAAERAQNEIAVRLADARRTLERTRELQSRNLVAQSALDTAEADVNALQARLEAARAEAAVAASTVRSREEDLADLVIRAPFAGVVISKDAQPGEMVSPVSAGGGFTRTGIATIVDMDSREIEVDVNEAFIGRVRPGQAAEATLDAYPDAPYPARVINIVPTADRQKATVKVRIAFEELDARVLPDMGVKVRFLEDAPPDAPKPAALVPSGAVVRDGERTYVWRVAEGRATARDVRLGREQGDRTGVLEGLAPGDLVIAQPTAALQDGARIVAPKS